MSSTTGAGTYQRERSSTLPVFEGVVRVVVVRELVLRGGGFPPS
jgi:hypothetical protein